MYEQIFHFDSRPFTATPYVKHYFAGEAIQQSLDQASQCIERGSGPVIVTGTTGTGKTLLLAMLEEQFQSEFNVVNLGCTRMVERRELLQSVLYKLQLPFKDLSETELRFSLINYLKPSEQCPNGILLLVDEAHYLPTEMLDEFRLITNFIRDGQPQVRLVMAGLQRLEENLNDAKLESFNQRIAARCFLSNMNRNESARYVTEHIDRAGGNGAQLFRNDSLRAIHDVSDGCPRLINQICDHAMILAATRGLTEITSDCIHEAWADVQSIPGSFNPTTNAPAVVQDLKQENNWAVIEFGLLDESSDTTKQDTEQGSCYELEISEDETIAEVVDSFNESAVISEELMPDLDHQEFEPGFASVASDEESSTVEQAAEPDAEEEHEENKLTSEELPMAMPDLETEPVSDISPVAAATEMAAQLTAEFGNELENDLEYNSKNADVTDLALEESQIIDQVESERAAIFGIEETNEQLITANETADLCEETQFASDPSTRLDDELTEEQLIVDTESTYESTFDVQVQDQEPSMEDTISGSYDSDFADSETDESTESIAERDESLDIEVSHPKLRELVDSVDPFEETFEEEENLIDQYAPFVAHQNQSSLSVTTDDLSMLTPDDERGQGEVQEQTNLETDFATPVSTTSDSQFTSPVFDQAKSFEVENESDDQANEVVSMSDVEQELASHTNHEQHQHLESKEISESTTETNSDADSELGSRQKHEDTDEFEFAAPNNIREEAEKILQRLSKTRHVSCETTATEAPFERPDPTQMGNDNNGPIAEEEMDVADSNPCSPVGMLSSEYCQQNTALDESQQILNEILEHRNSLAQQREELSAVLSNKLTESDEETGESVSDNEMIIVSRMEQQSDESTVAPETPVPFSTTPVSTGRAERMDYQKLFDQLREISGPES